MKRIQIIIALLFMVCGALNAQNFSLEGRVQDLKTTAPLPGATVMIKETGAVKRTDSTGFFKIPLPSAGSFHLSVAYTGYETKTLVLSALQSGLVIGMTELAFALEDVTVSTGYQSIPKERATGSFSTITKDQLNRLPTTGILERLEGAGSSLLFDKQSISRPYLTVRGFSSIIGPKDPLIILDNFPYEGSINNINPNDVESVTILKDAAAASIWGTRAGNGVIVITTKSGKPGQPRLEFSSSVTMQNEPQLSDLKEMSVGDFIETERFLFSKGFYTATENSAARPSLTPVVETLILQRTGAISASEADKRIAALGAYNYRVQHQSAFYKNAMRQQHSLSLSGSGPSMKYYAAAGYDKNISELSVPLERISFRLNNDWKASSKLTITTSVNYTSTNTSNGNPAYGSMHDATHVNLYPYARLTGDNGEALAVTYQYRLPYLDTAGKGKLLDWNFYPLKEYQSIHTTSKTNDLLVNLGINYKIGHGFSIDLRHNYEQQTGLVQTLTGIENYTVRSMINNATQINGLTGAVSYAIPKGSLYDRRDADLIAQGSRLQINYQLNKTRHAVNAIAGMERREIWEQGQAGRIYGYDDNQLTFGKVDYVTPYKSYVTGGSILIPDVTSISDSRNRYVSAFANAAYTFLSRYTLSASARQDASNLFGVSANDRWQPLWSAGAAWKISREPWFHSKWISSAGLRLTYGYSGNLDPSRSALTTLQYTSNATYTGFTYARLGQINNPLLRWERVNTVNLGLDLVAGKTSATLEYYIKKGVDLFGTSPVDYTNGLNVANVIRNVAAMKGSGFDVTINSEILSKRNFRWNVTALLNYNTSKVTSYYTASTSGASFVSNGFTLNALVGKPLYSIMTLKYAGLDPLTGNPRGLLDGVPSTDYTAILGAKTQVGDLDYAGPALPPFHGSLLNEFGYKKFSIGFSIQFKTGYYFRRSSINYSSLYTRWEGHSDYALRWKKPGDELFTDVPSQPYPVNNNREGFYNASSILVEKADHVRLQYINAAYTLDKAVYKWLPFASAQVFANVSNVGILWRANNKHIDPDYREGFLPATTSFTIGIRVKR